MMHNDGWDHTKLIAETIANQPLTNQPGTHWAYSNFGYCILGRVIEQITGQPYDAYVKGNILAPLWHLHHADRHQQREPA